MPNYGSPASQFCMLRDNAKLRNLVKFKVDALDMTQQKLAKELGIANYRLSKYLHNKKPHITQTELMRLCEYLGIEVSLNIEIVK